MPTAFADLTETELNELIRKSAPARSVYEWMKGRNLFLKASKSDEVEFQFTGKTETQVSFIITQVKKLPNALVVISNLEFIPIHFNALTKLSPKDKDDFLWSLKKELIFAPATFNMIPDGRNPKSIQFAKEIAFDELSEGRLHEALDAVCRSTIWTAWTIVRKFGEP